MPFLFLQIFTSFIFNERDRHAILFPAHLSSAERWIKEINNLVQKAHLLYIRTSFHSVLKRGGNKERKASNLSSLFHCYFLYYFLSVSIYSIFVMHVCFCTLNPFALKRFIQIPCCFQTTLRCTSWALLRNSSDVALRQFF